MKKKIPWPYPFVFLVLLFVIFYIQFVQHFKRDVMANLYEKDDKVKNISWTYPFIFLFFIYNSLKTKRNVIANLYVFVSLQIHTTMAATSLFLLALALPAALALPGKNMSLVCVSRTCLYRVLTVDRRYQCV